MALVVWMPTRARRRGAPVLAATALGVLAIAAPLAADPPLLLLWNSTGSAPRGLWRVSPTSRPSVGDWVALRPPHAWMTRQGYVGPRAHLLKQVAARSPSTVCRQAGAVMIDGRRAGLARSRDHAGRPLPAWRGCRQLGAAEVFLLNAAPDSLDGRYFGVISARALRGRAAPLLLESGR